MGCASLLFGNEFSDENIARTRAAKGLLSMEIEVGTACNFKCRYCYVGDGCTSSPGDCHELSYEELRDVIAQARALGARKIILLGGEPMLYDFTPALCEWIRARDMGVELFTNGTNMTPANAARLFALGVHVVLKWHSSDHHTQDWLSGIGGAAEIMEAALRTLRSAGYPSASSRLALSTVICRQNLAELPEWWRWLRTEGIDPYLEMVTPQGRARQDGPALTPEPEEMHRLFEAIHLIDHEEFGKEWDPQPPLVGNRCLRHAYSCLVNAAGDVMPCVGVTIPLGNVRQQSLAAILADSEVIADLRNYENTIQGACSRCDKAATCYGCRGAAFQLTGNYLGSDPLCWRNRDGADCSALPIAAARLVPHQPPARMIDALTAVGERTATVAAAVTTDNPFVRDGVLAPAAHIELMAQAAAALHGFRTRLRHDGVAHRGMLVGARNFEAFEPIRVGDAVTISLYKEASLGTVGILQAEVRRGATLVSQAELKTWYEQ